MTNPKGRRLFFGSLAVFGAGLLSAWVGRRSILRRVVFGRKNDNLLLTPAPSEEGGICFLTSRQVEGPFYFPSPERKDIREGRPGKPMKLRLQILRSPGCTPIEGAVVEVWHTDAEGVYSGYPAEVAHDLWKSLVLIGRHGEERNGELHVEPLEKSKFLRGLQRAGPDGWVEFDTIFPGWYEGRVPHIHFKVFVNGREELTSQFYLDQATCDRVYTTVAPYAQYGKCPIGFENDLVLKQDAADGLLLRPIPQAGGPLQAAARIAIRQA